jgi:hypothetical protein
MPTRLRAAADGCAGTGESAFRVCRRRVLGVVSGGGHGLQGHHGERRRLGHVHRRRRRGDGVVRGPAQGRSAEEIIDDLLKDKQPDATVAYVLPNTTVGYQLGFGEVLDVYPQGGATVSRTRIVVMAAVKNDLALVGAAIGPYRKFAPGNGPGVPSGANLELAQDLGKYVNSFLWKGDPPR